MLVALLPAFSLVMTGLAALDKDESNVIKNGKTDKNALEPLIRELATMLRAATPKAMDLIPKMERMLGVEHQNQLSELRDSVNAFHFGEAMEVLDRITRKLDIETGGKDT